MEYTEDQLTDWFCGFVPTIEGAYEVRVNGGGGIYAWWTKEVGWGAASGSPLGASGAMYRGGRKDHYHTVGEWRGLNFNPQAPQNPPKKKGNKRKTMYVVHAWLQRGEVRKVVGSYTSLNEAIKKKARYKQSWIEKIRFRTPEA